MLKGYKKFKYKNKVFMVIENEFDFIPGIRFKRNGIECISIFKGLSKRKKQLEFHRLITGKGLRDIRTHKKVNFYNGGSAKKYA